MFILKHIEIRKSCHRGKNQKRMEKLNYSLVELRTEEKWLDKWFVVGDLTIDILLKEYNYFSLSAVYALSIRNRDKQQFVVMKPRRNLRRAWSRLDILGFIGDLKGLLTEDEKMCGNYIYCVTDRRIIGRDEVTCQKIFMFSATDNAEKTEQMEKFLKGKNMAFIIADDVPFRDYLKKKKKKAEMFM